MNVAPVMAVSFVGILVLLGLLVGGLVLFVALLTNKKTRPVGIALLAVGGLAVVGIMFLVPFISYQKYSVEHTQVMTEMREEEARLEASMRLDQHAAEAQPSSAVGGSDSRIASTYAEAGQTVAQAHGGPELPTAHVMVKSSWARVIVILLALGAVFGVMKLLNSERSGLIAVAGVLVVAVAGVVLWRFAGVDRPARAVVAAHEAWDHVTRPRIDLSDRVAGGSSQWEVNGPLLKYTVVVNGRELTFNDDTPIDDAIAEIRAIWEKDDQTINVETGNSGFTTGGAFNASQVGVALHEARKAARQRALEEDPPPAPDAEQPPVAADSLVAKQEPQRPAWVDNPPKRIGKVYRQVVETGPYHSAEECYQQLPEKLMDAARMFAKRSLAGPDPSEYFMTQLGITQGLLLQEVCVDEYLETYHSKSVGEEMRRLYVQVEFDDAFRQRLERGYAAYKRRDVMEVTTLFGVGALLLIGGVFGLLKLDDATKGYYTKRLFLGVPAAIIGFWLLLLFLDAIGIVDF